MGQQTRCEIESYVKRSSYVQDVMLPFYTSTEGSLLLEQTLCILRCTWHDLIITNRICSEKVYISSIYYSKSEYLYIMSFLILESCSSYACRERCPQYLAEVEGLAAGSGLPFKTIIMLNINCPTGSKGNCVYQNIRTVHLLPQLFWTRSVPL